MTYDQGEAMGALSTVSTKDTEWIRQQFPALSGSFAYLENAGGSQVPASVIRRISGYFEGSYVQLGASYPQSREATEIVRSAHELAHRIMNGDGVGTTILGASTTALIQMIAECYAKALKPGDELVVAECGHEANIGPWVKSAERGFEVRFWKVDPQASDCTIDGLRQVLSPRTKIVAFPHVSNLLGAVWDVAEITKICHEAGAKVVVDGVAYAPHRAIDVRAWDVDWYACSMYKVYGPHIAALFGKSEAFAELEGPNHYFFPRDALPEKFEPGGVSHEACAGLLGTGEYLQALSGSGEGGLPGRAAMEAAFSCMEGLELPLQGQLIEYLLTKQGVRIVGPSNSDPGRVPTISFISSRRSPREVVEAVDKSGVGIRYGHMYSKRLCEALQIDPTEGVVRVSAVHYNTHDEIERLIQALETAL